jgi:uncharacterized DUF497 family protein
MTPIEFDWDNGNMLKNVTRHRVTSTEAESVFNDQDKIIGYDNKHSAQEIRFDCIGMSLDNRVLRISFVTRSGKVSIISARNASQKEKSKYKSQIR